MRCCRNGKKWRNDTIGMTGVGEDAVCLSNGLASEDSMPVLVQAFVLLEVFRNLTEQSGADTEIQAAPEGRREAQIPGR